MLKKETKITTVNNGMTKKHMSVLRKRVQHSIQFLDDRLSNTQLKNWYMLINIDTLNMASRDFCVLGQLPPYKDIHAEYVSGYDAWLIDLSLRFGYQSVHNTRLAFSVNSFDDLFAHLSPVLVYETLTRIWREELLKKRHKKKVKKV